MSVQFERFEKKERKKEKKRKFNFENKTEKNMTPCYFKNIKLLLLLSRLIIDPA